METLKGDRPLTTADSDRLGFRHVAKRLAKALTDEQLKGGLVIGLEGRWGSGKSSLLKLITEEIGLTSPRTEIVDYRPWLVNDRDGLLASLFDELALAVEAVQSAQGDVQSATANRARRAADGLRGFAKKVSKLGPLASIVAGLVPDAGPIVDTIRQVAESLATADSTPLSALKDNLSNQLADLDARIIVTIDDVDRLEPTEAVELLRLVRAVADFPNVIYVLCYDTDVLARNVQTSLGIGDGHAFVEKIVQLVVPVPSPEAFDLRQWFAAELALLTGPISLRERRSLDSAVDVEGGRRLLTPRAVVRVLDALRFKIPALRGEVDIGDLVWLELIKVDNHALYRWIEIYCTSQAATWPGRVQISDEAAKVELTQLEGYLAEAGLTFDQIEWELDERLPAIGHHGDRKLYVRVQKSDLAAAIRDRRLSSPDHHRLYFALATPRNAPRSGDLEKFEMAGGKSAEAVGQLLIEWLSLTQTNGVSRSEVILYRLDTLTLEQLGGTFRKNLLLALANVLDIAATTAPTSPIGSFALWHEAERLWPLLLGGPGDKPRNEVIAVFAGGKALGWLTDLFRTECFAHGTTGEPPRGGGDLTAEELRAVTSAMIQRYRALGLRAILKLPMAINMLWAWYQAGDHGHVLAEIAKITKSDTGLVAFLDRFTSTATSSVDGERVVLNKSSIDKFFDYDKLVRRLEGLAGRRSKVGKRAKELLANIEAAVRF